MTLADAARELGLSASRVSAIHEQTMARLQRHHAQQISGEISGG
jgi:hypothetical protein